MCGGTAWDYEVPELASAERVGAVEVVAVA